MKKRLRIIPSLPSVLALGAALALTQAATGCGSPDDDDDATGDGDGDASGDGDGDVSGDGDGDAVGDGDGDVSGDGDGDVSGDGDGDVSGDGDGDVSGDGDGDVSGDGDGDAMGGAGSGGTGSGGAPDGGTGGESTGGVTGAGGELTGGAPGSGGEPGGCQEGFFDVDGSPDNGCECEYLGDDVPDAALVDANCDGIDGDLQSAVFVSDTGSDANDGSIDSPLLTIQAALDLAEDREHDVYASGAFTPALTIDLRDGVSLYGGFDADTGWSRSAEARTVVQSSAIVAISGDELLLPVVLEGLEVSSANAVAPGTSSMAVYLRSSAGVTLRHSTIVAGAGRNGNGSASVGSRATQGGPGSAGGPGCEDSEAIGCGSCNTPSVGDGADPVSCSTGVSGRGGDGGTPGYAAGSGGVGQVGRNPAGGTTGGGTGGQGRLSATAALNPNALGGTGNEGSDGADGTAGAPRFLSGGYFPWHGNPGLPGANGSGGGGGGGGGGGVNLCDSFGGGGGGGGSGGCGGRPTQGAMSGGGSFAVYAWGSSITVEDCSLFTGNGGAGGNAGTPELGGFGGEGAIAGNTYGSNYGAGQDDATQGAKGGWGGQGGDGGAGGGGAGGPSIGILVDSSSDLNVIDTTYTLGFGGPGGNSSQNDGPTGLREQTHTAP